MRSVIQRARRAFVTVGSEVVGAVDEGVAVCRGETRRDTEEQAGWLAHKIAGLRIFDDADAWPVVSRGLLRSLKGQSDRLRATEPISTSGNPYRP